VSEALATGRIYLSGRLMLKGFFRPLLCSLAFVGQMYAQEVVVPRETRPEAPTETTPSSESEKPPSESTTPARVKPKPREKKSVAPTLEQMRASGALAVEGRSERSVPQPTRTGSSRSETAAAASPAVSPTATPVKREAHIPQKSTPRPSAPRGTKLEPIGPVRPTMIESGREQPNATPSGR
jgi:pyruvate/2-oxoglutarate dehydrogenase complex dihydrolipoamide acyltransferase (E2) component